MISTCRSKGSLVRSLLLGGTIRLTTDSTAEQTAHPDVRVAFQLADRAVIAVPCCRVDEIPEILLLRAHEVAHSMTLIESLAAGINRQQCRVHLGE